MVHGLYLYAPSSKSFDILNKLTAFTNVEWDELNGVSQRLNAAHFVTRLGPITLKFASRGCWLGFDILRAHSLSIHEKKMSRL